MTSSRRPCRAFCAFLLLLSITLAGAPAASDTPAPSPWQGTDIDLGFLEETLEEWSCARSDRGFLSCVGAVQRVLDVQGQHLQLIPAADLAGSHPGRGTVRRFGAAVVFADPALRIGAPGNALEVMRARAHRIVRWRERLDPALRRGVAFTAIRRWLEDEVIEPARASEYVAAAIDGYLRVGDAHARIAPAASAQGAKDGSRGAGSGDGAAALVYSGIGAGIQPVIDAALVTAVVPGGPAAQAGLRVHDFLLAIDGDPTSGLAAGTLVERLRGKVGTEVALSVKRQDETLELTVLRGPVSVRNVTAAGFVDRGWQFAYVKIDGFLRPDTCREVRRELDKELKPTLNGLILDLRDNSGGLIDQAVCVADLFLPPDELVLEIRHVRDAERIERVRTRREPRTRVPMVTLVNATTGSASEVLAGALQDHGRSLVVGELTFGKGTVQTVRPWRESRSIQEFFTTARYYRPSGVGVQLVGIEPDVEVREHPGAAPGKRVVLRERDLFPTALPREPEAWAHPDPALSSAVRDCTEDSGLAPHRLIRAAEGSRDADHTRVVGQDALVCLLTLRL